MTGMISRDMLGLLLAVLGALSAAGLVVFGRRIAGPAQTAPRPAVVGWRVAESLGWLFAAIALAAGLGNLLG